MGGAEKSVSELQELLVHKDLSSTELTKAYIERIQTVDPELKAYLTVLEDQALTQAAEVDRKIAQGEELGALEGIPMALKDNMCTEGVRTKLRFKDVGKLYSTL